MSFYVAARMDGSSFLNESKVWTPGKTIKDSGQLAVSTEITDAYKIQFPCRLFRVEPVGEVKADGRTNNSGRVLSPAWTAVEELPAHLAFGPQGTFLEKLVFRARSLTPEDGSRIYDRQIMEMERDRNAYNDGVKQIRNAIADSHRVWSTIAIQEAASQGALDYAEAAGHGDAYRRQTSQAAYDAVFALSVRDLISENLYNDFTRPWRRFAGDIHPGDGDVS